jgi:hypothetical protein
MSKAANQFLKNLTVCNDSTGCVNYFVVRNQFRAQPLNEHVLTHHGIGVKVVPRKPPTVPEPFSLSSGYRRVNTTAELEDEEQVAFHANPVPKAILDGVVVSSEHGFVLYLKFFTTVLPNYRLHHGCLVVFNRTMKFYCVISTDMNVQ